MTTRRMALPKLTIGLDLGDRFTELCAVHAHGQVVATARLRTTPAALERHFAGHPRRRIVLEVGTHSPWGSRLLERLGHEVLVANARQLRLIYGSDRKSDGAPGCRRASAPAFATKAAPGVPPELRGALGPLLELIARLTHAIRGMEGPLERVAPERYPETARLRQPSGVGLLTALCYGLSWRW